MSLRPCSEFSVILLRQLLISEHRLPFLLCFFSYLWLWPDVEKHKSKSHLIFELCDGTCYFCFIHLFPLKPYTFSYCMQFHSSSLYEYPHPKALSHNAFHESAAMLSGSFPLLFRFQHTSPQL